MCPSRYRRTDRVSALVLREVTRIVREEVRDPRIGFVTFTGAEVAPDLATGRVFVSVMGAESEKEESLAGLRSAAPFIRSRLWDLLDLKTVPELSFELDRTLERAARIDAILERLQEDESPPAGRGPTPAGETGADADVDDASAGEPSRRPPAQDGSDAEARERG